METNNLSDVAEEGKNSCFYKGIYEEVIHEVDDEYIQR
jgi:hypothetical protein